MPKAKPSGAKQPARKRRPALSPEARENQLIALAMDLVEQRLLDGTASSQETTHFLKLGSTEAKIKQRLLQEQATLAAAKTEALESARNMAEKYEAAIEAMRIYSGLRNDSYEE